MSTRSSSAASHRSSENSGQSPAPEVLNFTLYGAPAPVCVRKPAQPKKKFRPKPSRPTPPPPASSADNLRQQDLHLQGHRDESPSGKETRRPDMAGVQKTTTPSLAIGGSEFKISATTLWASCTITSTNSSPTMASTKDFVKTRSASMSCLNMFAPSLAITPSSFHLDFSGLRNDSDSDDDKPQTRDGCTNRSRVSASSTSSELVFSDESGADNCSDMLDGSSSSSRGTAGDHHTPVWSSASAESKRGIHGDEVPSLINNTLTFPKRMADKSSDNSSGHQMTSSVGKSKESFSLKNTVTPVSLEDHSLGTVGMDKSTREFIKQTIVEELAKLKPHENIRASHDSLECWNKFSRPIYETQPTGLVTKECSDLHLDEKQSESLCRKIEKSLNKFSNCEYVPLQIKNKNNNFQGTLCRSTLHFARDNNINTHIDPDDVISEQDCPKHELTDTEAMNSSVSNTTREIYEIGPLRSNELWSARNTGLPCETNKDGLQPITPTTATPRTTRDITRATQVSDRDIEGSCGSIYEMRFAALENGSSDCSWMHDDISLRSEERGMPLSTCELVEAASYARRLSSVLDRALERINRPGPSLGATPRAGSDGCPTASSNAEDSPGVCGCCGPRVVGVSPEDLRRQRALLRPAATTASLSPRATTLHIAQILKDTMSRRREAVAPSEDVTCTTSRSVSEWSEPGTATDRLD